jgi:hypothetical protein
MSRITRTPASENSVVLRSWLMRNPRPKGLRVFSKDGREYDIIVKPGASWTETAASILALHPERIEANSDDTLLRAVVVDELIAKEGKQEEARAAVSAAMNSTDPETQRLIVFAELLTRTSERAIECVERTCGSAFERMQLICDSLATQANAAQQSANELTVGIRNLLVQQAQEAVEQATTAQSPFEKMAENFMAGQTLAQAGASTSGAWTGSPGAKPNGKG